MPRRSIFLSEHQHGLVEKLVRSGRYQNASEVLREGLRLIEERQCIEKAQLKALKKGAREGWTDASAGRYADVADDQLEGFTGQLGLRAKRLAYEQDDGPLTAAQIRAVRRRAQVTMPTGNVRDKKSLL